MAAPMCLAKHSVLLGKCEEELFEVIDAAMTIAAWRNPKAFMSRRDEIAKNLFSFPENVIGSVYEKSHCTRETTEFVSDVTKGASEVVADDCMKKGTTPSSKKDDKKITNPNFEASRVVKSLKSDAANNKKKIERNSETTEFVSDVTKGASKVVADYCMKKGTTPSSKKITDRNFEASRVVKSRKFDDANSKKKIEHSFEVSKAKPPESVNNNKDIGSLLDQKLKAYKRKFEQTSKPTRKTKLIDLSEIKELIKPEDNEVKRPRFRR